MILFRFRRAGLLHPISKNTNHRSRGITAKVVTPHNFFLKKKQGHRDRNLSEEEIFKASFYDATSLEYQLTKQQSRDQIEEPFSSLIKSLLQKVQIYSFLTTYILLQKNNDRERKPLKLLQKFKRKKISSSTT